MHTSETLDMPSAPAAGGQRSDADAPALSPGAMLGAYRVESLLGEGGMGRVYVAEHTVIKRRVALKVLRPSLVDSQRSVERFFAEAEAVNRIRHPGIVEVTDLFLANGTPCIVMELLEGHTLASEIAGGALDAARVIDIGRAIAAALAATHAAGVVHRDLKPDNVVVTSDGVKILDFGVAKLLDAPTSTATGQTAAGAILGTPEYMAPEQLAGKPVDARADIYTLGVTLYHAASGRVPFRGDSFGDFVVKHLTQEPPALDDVPPGLARAIVAMLAKEPDARPASMRDVDVLLAEALTWRPPRTRRGPVAIAAALAVVAIGGAWQLGAFDDANRDPAITATANDVVTPADDVVTAANDVVTTVVTANVVTANVATQVRPALTAPAEAAAVEAAAVEAAAEAVAVPADAMRAEKPSERKSTKQNASAPKDAAVTSPATAAAAAAPPDVKVEAPAKRGVIDPFEGGE